MKLYKRILTTGIVMTMALQTAVYAGPPSTSRDFVRNSSGVSVTQRVDLTVEEAAKRAIANNSNIQSMYDANELSEDSLTKLRLEYQETETWQLAVAAAINLRQAELASALTLRNIEAMEDNVEISIINMFAAILKSEQSLALYDESLELQRQALEISRLRTSLGLESQVNFDTARNAYEKAVQERNSMNNAIEEAYISLNKLMGTNLNYRYNLQLDLDFEPLETVNLTAYVSRYTQQNVSVREAENKVEIAKLTLDQHYSASDFVFETNDVEKQQKEIDYKRALENLDTVKRSVEEAIITTYNNILDLENSREVVMLEIENVKRDLSVLELKLELGQATQLEVDRAVLALKELEEQLNQIEIEHTIAVMKFKNPNIVVNSSKL